MPDLAFRSGEQIADINDHREALGRPKFDKLTPNEARIHRIKITKNAPYGNDPWANEDGINRGPPPRG